MEQLTEVKNITDVIPVKDSGFLFIPHMWQTDYILHCTYEE